MTRRANERDYREILCTSPIPSSPHQNRKVVQVMPQDTFVSNHVRRLQTLHVPFSFLSFSRFMYLLSLHSA
jgi:hypothetical protein